MNGMFERPVVMYQANAGGGGGTDNGTQNAEGKQNAGSDGNTTTLTFEAWQEKLPPDQKALIEGHTKNLKTALQSERDGRKDLEKQLRDLAKKAEAGSDAQTQLTKMADDLQISDRKADFYEAAHAAGVRNLKLAYTAAVTDEMFDKHGRVNFDEMKKSYPELFVTQTTTNTRGNAGSGTNNNQQPVDDMNSRIRGAAGRK